MTLNRTPLSNTASRRAFVIATGLPGGSPRCC